MRATTKMALKPYLEAIRRTCSPLTQDQLLEMILTMAKEVPAAERGEFLHRIESLRPGGQKTRAAKSSDPGVTVKEIGKLERSILQRIKDIENGDFDDWDEDEDYRGYNDRYGYYEDEDVDILGSEHKEELAALFEEADRLFLQGELSGAGDIFTRLFALLVKVEQESENWIDCGVDLREARARLCRCVYEGAEQASRVRRMVEAMEIEARPHRFDEEDSDDYPLLQDVIDSRPGDLPELADFLSVWEKMLASRSCRNNRLATLRLEAAYMRGGLEEVARLAREWRKEQPLGYLTWLARLQDTAGWPDLAAAAREAIAALPAGKARAAAAGFLLTAGSNLHDNEAILEGKRERFVADPGSFNLLALSTEAGRQQIRERELAQALAVLAHQKKGDQDVTVLRTKALLMAGCLDEAFAMANQAKAVGWSYGSPAGVVFASILHLARGSNKNCALIEELLRYYAQDSHYLYDRMTISTGEAANDFAQEIVMGLSLAHPAETDLARYRKWTETIGHKRIQHIVGNKQRGAYDRAARVLCALAEALAAGGEKGKAQALLLEYCKTRYNRHTAFRNEVKKAVKESPLLRGMEAGL